MIVAQETVFIVDDDPAQRKSLTWLLGSVDLPVQTFASAQAFLEFIQPEHRGCLVLDMRMSEMSGLELQEELLRRGISLPIIVITAYADVPMAVRAMKNGALDFIEKPVREQLLLDRIYQALKKDRENRSQRDREQQFEDRCKQLTNREREVMDFVIKGMSSKEIANQLGVSFKTIEAHRAKIMKKMEAKSVPHLIHMHHTYESDQKE